MSKSWEAKKRGPGTRTWRVNRQRALARDQRECQIREWGCLGVADTVDHIIPLMDGGTDDLSNLQSVCAPCHARKTQSEQVRAMRARKANGRKHPGIID
ncbi:HNH endonuclease [Tsukamurella tyrosinosolvens]|uniref:HNH endonuclease n=1 Tax=Tsukamurella tyrosinosolvens TaxID=57704 RepID=UPI002DD43030|nr:HNH endonuclease signature motif containing protein [Tsukamurella tyrosinosolvens]MEC4611822.1 HNH endonuclease signature motif containing protein [Tsukamurella tyrosinosolvens]